MSARVDEGGNIRFDLPDREQIVTSGRAWVSRETAREAERHGWEIIPAHQGNDRLELVVVRR